MKREHQWQILILQINTILSQGQITMVRAGANLGMRWEIMIMAVVSPHGLKTAMLRPQVKYYFNRGFSQLKS